MKINQDREYYCIVCKQDFKLRDNDIFWILGGDWNIGVCAKCYPKATKFDILNGLEKALGC